MSGVELFALPAALGGAKVTLGTALTVAGTAFSAISSIQQGNAARAAGNYNASLYERNAEIARQRGAADEARQRRLATMRAGSNRAAIGASGVTLEGSPLDILESNAAQEELDALMIRWNATNDAEGLLASAELERAKGKNAQRAGYMQAGSAILLGGVKAYDTLKFPTTPTPAPAPKPPAAPYGNYGRTGGGPR